MGRRTGSSSSDGGIHKSWATQEFIKLKSEKRSVLAIVRRAHCIYTLGRIWYLFSRFTLVGPKGGHSNNPPLIFVLEDGVSRGYIVHVPLRSLEYPNPQRNVDPSMSMSLCAMRRRAKHTRASMTENRFPLFALVFFCQFTII